MRRCENCNKEYDEKEFTFCPECGSKLVEIEAETSSEVEEVTEPADETIKEEHPAVTNAQIVKADNLPGTAVVDFGSKKRSKKPLLIAGAVVIALVLVAVLVNCLGGMGKTPLEKAYGGLEKLAANSEGIKATYNEDVDQLFVVISDEKQLDPAFEIINESIEGQEVGNIIFDGNYKFAIGNTTFMPNYAAKIADLPCAHMNMLGISDQIASEGDGVWTEAALKTDHLYIQSLTILNFCPEDKLKNLEGIKILDTESTSFTGVSRFKGVEEIGILPDYLINLQNSAPGQESYNMQSYYNNDPGSFLTLKELPDLQRLVLAPNHTAYSAEGAAELLFAVSNVVPDLQVNKPDTDMAENEMVAVTDVDYSAMNPQRKVDITNSFLKYQAEDCYNKGIKLTKKSGSPVITGKALVYVAEPDITQWSGSRDFSSTGEVIDSGRLDAKIDTPERCGDFQTFVFAYPTYKETGKYTSGTRAYTETYYVQVFDFENGIQYDAQKVDSAAAPQEFSYYGSAPAKHSGSVGMDKILEFIKKVDKQ